MAIDLSDTLVVGISSTALFDLSISDAHFQKQFATNRDEALLAYRSYTEAHENDSLEPGTGFPLVQALTNLNRFQKEGEAPLIEVVIMSRNSPETGIRVFNNIRKHGLAITRSVFSGGESVVDYLDAYDVDLFLTTNASDGQRVADGGNCAVAVVKDPPAVVDAIKQKQVRIAFDADAVLFSEESEIMYKAEGLAKFQQEENSKQNTPMNHGPYAKLLMKLARLQERLPQSVEQSPVRIAIVTARSSPAEMRVIKTLRHWGVYVNEIFFLGGIGKAKVLQAFHPHIFFDDQNSHLDPASKVVPSGKVPYQSSSVLYDKSTTIE